MEISEINWIDGALSAVLLASTVFGLFRGLIRGVFGIASLIVAFFVARRYGEYTGRAVSSLLGESAFVFALGYVLVFVTAMLAFAALTYLIRRAAARVDLGAMDKFGGLLFGVLRGGVFGALIVAVLASLPLQKSAAWNESVLLPMFGYAMEFAVGADALGGYGRYWRFDGEHRPRLVLAEFVSLPSETASAKSREKKPRRNRKDPPEARDPLADFDEKKSQRDDLLDALNDEIAGQAVSKNEAADRNAQRRVEREREQSFLQELRDLLTCEGGECAAEDE